MTRTGDIVDGRLPLAELIDGGFSRPAAIEVRAFTLFLQRYRDRQFSPELSYALGVLDGESYLELVAPEELAEVGRVIR